MSDYLAYLALRRVRDVQTIQAGGGSTVIQGAILGFTDVSALRASTTHSDLMITFLLGLSTKGDGQGGCYYYDASSSTADDGITVIKPNDVSGSGRWIKWL